MPNEMDSVREFVELTDEKASLKAQLDRVKSRMEELQEPIMKYFENNATDQVKTGGRTVHLRRQWWASPLDKDALVHALKQNDETSFMIEPRFMSSQLSAWVRELPRSPLDEPIIPTEFEHALKPTLKITLVATVS